jgi:hypothetical protein
MNTRTTDRIVRYSMLLALDRHSWSKQMRFGIYLDDDHETHVPTPHRPGVAIGLWI